MAYVKVPKDLGEIKSKIILNLTKRQLICFSIGAIIGITEYISLKGAIDSTIASFIMIFTMIPFFLLAIYEKDGRPLERIVFNILAVYMLRPKRRVYRKRRKENSNEESGTKRKQAKGKRKARPVQKGKNASIKR